MYLIYKYTEDVIWNEKEYEGALNNISKYLNENNIKVPKMPMQPIYYRAVAHCNNDSFEKGIQNFDWILHNFKLAPSILKDFRKLKNKCTSSSTIADYYKVCGQEQLGRGTSYSFELADPEVTIQTKSMQSINWNDLDRLKPGTSYLGESPGYDKLSTSSLAARKFNDANIESLKDSIENGVPASWDGFQY
ncbi:MAG: hypothetical protein IPP71_07945 [Bacteroidetes bacterium]|nr:hypothetical protein [Bacteroidota bacterium]